MIQKTVSNTSEVELLCRTNFAALCMREAGLPDREVRRFVRGRFSPGTFDAQDAMAVWRGLRVEVDTP
mgnify:CR=1 FL=1